MFIWMVYSCYFPIIRFYFSFSHVSAEIKDSQRVFPRFHHSINIVCSRGGPTDDVALALAGGVGANGGG